MSNNDKTDRTAIALKTLEEGIQRLTESGEWQLYLQMQATFHEYSFNNVLLIQAQRPDATRVASFNAWKKLGRSVLKGERAVWILAPMVSKVKREEHADDKNLDGEEEREARRVVCFRPVPVFAYEQTEGEPLPSPVQRLTGDAGADLFDRLRAFSKSNGCPVTVEDFEGRANGYYEPERHGITVRAALAPDQAAKTLAHEIAHSILHRDIEVYRAHRGDCELEAESVAFIVLNHFGIDSGSYSFGYLSVWQGGAPEAIKSLKTSAGRIQATAKAILSAIAGADDVDVDGANE